jgi:hypothetical protein
VSDNGHIILNVWIAIEKLVSPVPDEEPRKQKDDQGESESDTQRRNGRLFNRRYQQPTVRYHANNLSTLSIGCSDTSVGFSDATGGQIASPPSEGTLR